MQGFWAVAFILQWVLLLLITAVVIGMARYLGSIQERIETTAPTVTKYDKGDVLEDFELPDLSGRGVALANVIGQGRKAMLFYLSPDCVSCKTVVMQLEEVATRSSGLPPEWSIAVIFLGEESDVAQLLGEHQVILASSVQILVDAGGLVRKLYAIRHVPISVAVDEDGRVMDQSIMPYDNWIYKITGIAAPDQIVVAPDNGGLEPLILTTRKEQYVPN